MIKKTDIGIAALVFTSLIPSNTQSEQYPYDKHTATSITTEQTETCTYKVKEQEAFLNELFNQVKKMNPCIYKLPLVPKDKPEEIIYNI